MRRPHRWCRYPSRCRHCSPFRSRCRCPRHLRRLFAQHLGASPLAVAQTRRLHFAKTLVDETALPLTEVAFASGFASIRRFNAAFGTAYGRPPSALRRVRGRTPAAPALVLRLAFRPPYDWDGLLAFLAARAIPGVEAVEAGHYRRTVRVGATAGVIAVSAVPGADHLLLELPDALARESLFVAGRVRRLATGATLGVGRPTEATPLAAVHHHVGLSRCDPVEARAERAHHVDFALVEAVGRGLAERAESEVGIAKVSDGH